MSSPRYRHAHQQERKRWAKQVEQGLAFCAEPRCLMPDRWIHPNARWHLLHDPTGTTYIGVGHERCNTSEGATRGNLARARRRRWAL